MWFLQLNRKGEEYSDVFSRFVVGMRCYVEHGCSWDRLEV